MIRRDEMGVAPLYYWARNPLVNGSSVRELLARGVPARLSREGLWSYLLCGAVQEPYTLIQDVYSVPPGCSLCRVDGDVKIERYWQPDFRPGDFTREQAQDVVARVLEKAVRYDLETMGDSPAAFLSGGIDSSAIVALMRKLYTGTIRTFCVIHEDSRTDERMWARKVAERNGTEHTEFLLTGDRVKREIVSALDSYDQPSLDGINSYFAARFVSEAGVKSIFSGEGGDEVFAGYGQFRKPRLAYVAAKRLAFLRCGLGRWLGNAMTRMGRSEKMKKFGQLLTVDYDPYFLTRRQFDPGWCTRLLHESVGRFTHEDIRRLFTDLQEKMGTDVDFGDDLVNRCSWMEIRHNLLSMYVRDGVQTAAPFGLEIRTPLMDRDVVSLMMTIPGALKCSDVLSKPLLVGAAGDGIPMDCVTRPKQGFALPFDRFFREGLKDQLAAFVDSGGCGIFVRDEVRRVWNGYLSGKIPWARLWQLFVLDYWLTKNKVTW